MNCLIAGATGLVGQELLDVLLAETKISKVTAIARSETKQKSPKLKSIITPFDSIAQFSLPFADVAFCCLGTTFKKAGSKEAFRRVDHDYVVGFAQACLMAGVKTFILVSALGADAKSKVFYNLVKGETEDALVRVKFPNLIILRPSLLLGNRVESRPAEKIAQILGSLVMPLMVGPLAQFAPVKARAVAQKMLEEALLHSSRSNGVRIISNEKIVRP